MYRLSKKFRFETAHRLGKGYVGKCANIHGHSWNGELVVDCEALDKMAMGVDFGVLKVVLKEVEDKLDHTILLHKEDPLIEALKLDSTSFVLFDDNPTSEHLAKWIYTYCVARLEELVGLKCKVHSVVVEETCTSSCTYVEK